jgi:hypothetical protein
MDLYLVLLLMLLKLKFEQPNYAYQPPRWGQRFRRQACRP